MTKRNIIDDFDLFEFMKYKVPLQLYFPFKFNFDNRTCCVINGETYEWYKMTRRTSTRIEVDDKYFRELIPIPCYIEDFKKLYSFRGEMISDVTLKYVFPNFIKPYSGVQTGTSFNIHGMKLKPNMIRSITNIKVMDEADLVAYNEAFVVYNL